MKVILLNGSPRKGWNTDMMLQKAAEGAREAGAETEIINLYDLNYKGCRSCYGCRAKANKNVGHCVWNDDLKAVLQKIDKADALIIGSPIYYADVTAEVRAFLERFLYQYQDYDIGSTNATGQLKTACIYTMNVPEEYSKMMGVAPKYEGLLSMCSKYVGAVEAYETLHMKNYEKFHFGTVDTDRRFELREKQFPKDLEKAYELGKRVCA
ncbi:MAG: flavodoxin family protein [Eubacterium sp.]|nr:flavodoxin family protein [Eubacterium sp.]